MFTTAHRAHVTSPAQVVAGRTITLAGFAVCPWCLSPISTVLLALWLTGTRLPPLQVVAARESPLYFTPISATTTHRRASVHR